MKTFTIALAALLVFGSQEQKDDAKILREQQRWHQEQRWMWQQQNYWNWKDSIRRQ